MTCFLYFTSQGNLDSNQKINQNITPQSPVELYNQFHIMIPLVVSVDLIYLHPKTFSLLGLVKFVTNL